MTTASRADRVRRTLEHLRDGTTDEVVDVLPFGAAQYTDVAVATREHERVFARVPSIVAHTGELAEVGSSVAVRMPRHEVSVGRVDGGRVRAVGTTDAGNPVDLPVEERHGLIWLVDGPGASIDVAGWLGPEMDAVLAGYELGDLVVYRSEGFDERANWKLMQDAFIDNYHIQYAHPNTAGKHVHTNVQTVEDFGRHARMCSARKSIDRYLATDPADLVAVDLVRHVIEGHFLLPNSTLLRQPDDHFELLTFRPHPTDPAWCRMEMRLLVPTRLRSGLDPDRWERVWEKNWSILLAVLHQEDFPLLRDSQEALASADAADVVLGRNETVNQIFHRELRTLLA